jgi:hypothetical protein
VKLINRPFSCSIAAGELPLLQPHDGSGSGRSGSGSATAVRASDGESVPWKHEGGRVVFSLPGVLEVADAIVVR